MSSSSSVSIRWRPKGGMRLPELCSMGSQSWFRNLYLSGKRAFIATSGGPRSPGLSLPSTRWQARQLPFIGLKAICFPRSMTPRSPAHAGVVANIARFKQQTAAFRRSAIARMDFPFSSSTDTECFCNMVARACSYYLGRPIAYPMVRGLQLHRLTHSVL